MKHCFYAVSIVIMRTIFYRKIATSLQTARSGFNVVGSLRQMSQQKCCRDSCRILERYDYFNKKSRDFRDISGSCAMTSYHLVNRGFGYKARACGLQGMGWVGLGVGGWGVGLI